MRKRGFSVIQARKRNVLLSAAAGLGVLLLSYTAGASPWADATATVPPIGRIDVFLEQCPTNDPLYAQIRRDFEIRKNGVLVGDPPCTEPVSAMPIAQYTDELIAIQALRVIYYMEGRRSVAYPWTSGSLYDWMKSQIGGINLKGDGSYCCEMYGGRWSIVLGLQNQWDRDAAREWQGLSVRIALIGHEVRHVQGFGHVGGCPAFPLVQYGCDPIYDEGNIGSYGIEWWLNAKWLSGEINVGYGCPSIWVARQIGEWHLDQANAFRERMVLNAPSLLTMPVQPGGPCQEACPGDSDCDGYSNSREIFLGTNPNAACSATNTANDELIDAWPPDIDDNQQVTTPDVGSFVFHLNAVTGSPSYTARLDLDQNGIINTHDVGRLVIPLNSSCS
jgi:hypothetical protein